MRVIAKGTLRTFWERHAPAEQPLKAWYALMKHREFHSPNELKAEFGTVSLLADGHACFNVGGNKYRLVVHIRYDLGIIFVKRVLTHDEYDARNSAGTLIDRRKVADHDETGFPTPSPAPE